MLGLSILTEEAVVVVAIFSGVNPYKVASSLILEHGLKDDVTMLLIELRELVEILLLDPVEVVVVFYLFLQLGQNLALLFFDRILFYYFTADFAFKERVADTGGIEG